ncbi:MAG TPA: hypothetical protein VFO60_04875, partial [Candidatus Dormibacteraeota bacterium]|nr:hypothetical protein [Candidatus Dormibacteraeota bacterium]
DVGLVYTSTTGLEMACTGKPVVTAGTTHYRGRGFTVDPESPSEWIAAVERLTQGTPDDAERAASRELARRYAHMFFFRFHQDWPLVHEEARSRPRLRTTDASALAPGSDSTLDRIVAHVLTGRGPLVTPAEPGP